MKTFPSGDEVSAVLKSVGLALNPWGAVVAAGGAANPKRFSYQYLPIDLSPRELMVVSHCVGGWLSKNRSCLLQLDNSSGTLGQLELGYLGLPFDSQRACLHVLSDTDSSSLPMWLDVCRSIHALLLFELHGHFSVCPNSSDVLSVQDGCLYFSSTSERRIEEAEILIKGFQESPDVLPGWIEAEAMQTEK